MPGGPRAAGRSGPEAAQRDWARAQPQPERTTKRRPVPGVARAGSVGSAGLASQVSTIVAPAGSAPNSRASWCSDDPKGASAVGFARSSGAPESPGCANASSKSAANTPNILDAEANRLTPPRPRCTGVSDHCQRPAQGTRQKNCQRRRPRLRRPLGAACPPGYFKAASDRSPKTDRRVLVAVRKRPSDRRRDP